MTTLDDRSVVARKDHRCIWCGEKIKKGERYHVQVVIFEGELQRNKYHPECISAIDWADFGDDGFIPYEGKRGSSEPA